MDRPSLAAQLFKLQNKDGGWSYLRGNSWSEATALAYLALVASGVPRSDLSRSRTWLLQRQKADGGWSPADNVSRSTWVTSVAVLALGSEPELHPFAIRGCQFLAAQMTPPYSFWECLARRVEGLPSTEDLQGGSPWFPGTAAWVTPTALSILAMQRISNSRRGDYMRHNIETAKRYLLSRRCADNGWHHGGSGFHSESAPSYPETTGVALLALRGTRPDVLQPSLERAQELMARPGSAQGSSWLQLGLWAQGIRPVQNPAPLRCWTTLDLSLKILASTAGSPLNALTNASTGI